MGNCILYRLSLFVNYPRLLFSAAALQVRGAVRFPQNAGFPADGPRQGAPLLQLRQQRPGLFHNVKRPAPFHNHLQAGPGILPLSLSQVRPGQAEG